MIDGYVPLSDYDVNLLHKPIPPTVETPFPNDPFLSNVMVHAGAITSDSHHHFSQHENNAITLWYTNCLWLKHHDDPISILNFDTVWYIQSILFCIPIWLFFWILS
jgi:hypothetical protein